MKEVDVQYGAQIIFPGVSMNAILAGFKSLLSITLIFLCACSSSSVPSEIDELVFSSAAFAQPVAVNLPQEDSRDFFQKVKTTTFGMLGPLYYSNLGQINKKLAAYMSSKGFIEIQDVTMNSRYGQRPITFFFYQDEFRELSGVEFNDKGVEWKIGQRLLEEITFTNNYTGLLNGVTVGFYSVVFSYKLESYLPQSAAAPNLYEGKATLYLSPEDGNWKLYSLTLNDKGAKDLLAPILD